LSAQSTTDGVLCFEDLEVGTTYLSPGRTVTEADVVMFSGLSGDYTELHTNEEFAKKQHFGRRVAHGLLGVMIMSGLGIRALKTPMAMVAFLGIKEWNFRGPVFIGDTIFLRLTIRELRLTKSGDRGILTWYREVLNQRDEVVQEGMTTSMILTRAAWSKAQAKEKTS
jgi:acyl dehydratase